MERYDVVLIGAGLAGLQCARLLAQSGVRVLLADCKRSLADSVHTTGIFVRRTLEDFQLPEDCLGPAVRHVTLYSPRRRSLMLESPHAEFRVGRMGRLYQRFLDECLESGASWRPSTRYAGYEALKDELTVRLESRGQVHRVRARYLVGADGAQSRVGRDLGLDQNREWIVGVEEVWRDMPLAGPPRFHCFLDPRLAPGYLAWVVHDGMEMHLGVGGYAAQFDPLSALEKFRASVKGIVDLSRGRQIERRGGRIPVGGVLRRIGSRRGLLVGDAAGAVSPLTAGGLDPCMRLSQLAARVITDYLATDDTSRLAAYSGELFRARFVSRLWMRRLMAGVRQPLALELACALMRLPLCSSLASHIFFGRGSFPDVETSASPSLAVSKAPLS
ncbi:MAG TPA: NAD(P)/FAD-dependent oxidoreductase [Pyrinomonadaceae bacterium]|jgi:flavin-dependent dehydrogenase